MLAKEAISRFDDSKLSLIKMSTAGWRMALRTYLLFMNDWYKYQITSQDGRYPYTKRRENITALRSTSIDFRFTYMRTTS